MSDKVCENICTVIFIVKFIISWSTTGLSTAPTHSSNNSSFFLCVPNNIKNVVWTLASFITSTNHELHVAIAYPREYLRVVIQQIHQAVTWFIAAKFKKQNVEEVSICTATPNIPGRSCVCNLTSVNQQSLYCGRPVDARLSCEDWDGTYSLPIPPPRNVTPAEYQLIMDIPKAMSKNAIPHNISIVVNSQGQLPTVKPCAETSPVKTWEIDRPQGYWAPGDNWQSLVCERPNMTAEWTMSCLRNSSVWIFGDSNGLRFSNSISSLTKVEYNPITWPYQFTKTDKLNWITFTFTPTEYPVYLGQVWRPRLPYGGVAKQIDGIPSNGTHVLVIHYFLHVVPSHLSIAYLRLKAVRDAIQRLINRNPNVVVGLRGPHVSSFEFNYNHAIGGDNLGVYFLEMMQHIFADLKHKVIFLDGWEMTIALENTGFHPDDIIPYQLARTLLAFKCS